MANRKSDLKRKVLSAALKCSGGDLNKTFSFEELLVQAWSEDPLAWGLRGFERQHPDPERLHREVDSRGRGQEGLVGTGLLEKVQTRIYRLTPKGLVSASESEPASSDVKEKADRAVEGQIRRILEHPVFVKWLHDPGTPKRFRDAGHFWGVAPGTPPKTVRERIYNVEQTMDAALSLLESRETDQIGRQHGKILYDRRDVERVLEFQETLKQRFAADLRMLTQEKA